MINIKFSRCEVEKCENRRNFMKFTTRKLFFAFLRRELHVSLEVDFFKIIFKMIYEFCFENSYENQTNYHLDLIEFYRYKSKHFSYAFNQICNHYKALAHVREEKKNFSQFLKSREAITYLPSNTRSFFLTVYMQN